MPSDTSRKTVRFGEDTSRSGSSRSSASRSESGAETLYEQQALKQALQDTVKQVDEWKAKAQEVERQLTKKLRLADANLLAVKNRCDNLEEEKKDLLRDKKKLRDAHKDLEARLAALQVENDGLRNSNERLQKKPRDSEARAATTPSPKSGKLHRSESRRSKDADVEQQKDRLKGRFERSETSSDASSSKRSSSRAPRTTSRRLSSAAYADRPYVEPLGPRAARPTVSIPTPQPSAASPGRRFDGPVAMAQTGQPAIAHYQDPAYSSTPRSAGMERPTVFYRYDGLMSPTANYEDGNYHPHPL
ncbi:hypothetical protein KVR01_009921 [Diaporthe batatas]|uniref:uncharacterized protein n=1 Tax=Diaporthe batatas TaxID=748121 RepID=UPI001D0499A0|nr:uncharacterized protein KVR01_009921 [Diaporthe batatas]KAG8160385.1 hypothetical protein KVR01_009921 [Diaporthe batatas]